MRARKPWTTTLLYALCAPWDVIVLVSFALMRRAIGVELVREAGVVWAVLPDTRWLARHWRYSTTLGHVVLLQERARGTDVQFHERVHVRQFEGAAVSVWLVLLLCALGLLVEQPQVALALALVLGPWWSYFGASIAAALRCERGYMDNHFERHARAETTLYASSEKGVNAVPRS